MFKYSICYLYKVLTYITTHPNLLFASNKFKVNLFFSSYIFGFRNGAFIDLCYFMKSKDFYVRVIKCSYNFSFVEVSVPFIFLFIFFIFL